MSVDREYSKLKGSYTLRKIAIFKKDQAASSDVSNSASSSTLAPYSSLVPSTFPTFYHKDTVISTINIPGVYREEFNRKNGEYLLLIFHHDEKDRRTGKPDLYQCKGLDTIRKILVRNFDKEDYMVYSFDELARST